MNFVEDIKHGAIFIYPTDTIYGLGCNALDEKAVARIKEIKSRDKDKPLSIIAPSLEWINTNFNVEEGLDLNKYLPGAYTVLLKKKDMDFLPWISNNDRIGIRIPQHDFTLEIQKSGVPFVTTSVNLSGEKPANMVEEIAGEILESVDFIINSGELSGKPSTLVIDGKEAERK